MNNFTISKKISIADARKTKYIEQQIYIYIYINRNCNEKRKKERERERESMTSPYYRQ